MGAAFVARRCCRTSRCTFPGYSTSSVMRLARKKKHSISLFWCCQQSSWLRWPKIMMTNSPSGLSGDENQHSQTSCDPLSWDTIVCQQHCDSWISEQCHIPQQKEPLSRSGISPTPLIVPWLSDPFRHGGRWNKRPFTVTCVGHTHTHTHEIEKHTKFDENIQTTTATF